jgi:RecA-family ATPase
MKDSTMLRYICSLPNPGTAGIPHEVFYSDDDIGRARAEKFAQLENKPGRGVYDCIGVLQEGAKSRRIETIAELDHVIADLDLKNIVESRDEALQCLRNLLLPPSEIRDSGYGLHAIWYLKEPVSDSAGLAQAEDVMRQLAELLAADPAPTHRAALLRRPGTDNTKNGGARRCCVIETRDQQYDISEFDAMFDLYGDRPKLTRKQEAPKTDNSDDEHKAPVDIDARLAAMQYGGAGDSAINITRLQVCSAMLAHGIGVEEIVRTVMDATRRCVADNPKCANWRWTPSDPGREESEEQLIWRSCVDFIVKHPERLGDRLPDKLRQQLGDILADGKRPRLSRNASGYHLRGYGEPHKSAEGAHAPDAETPKEQPRAANEKRVLKLRPFAPFDVASLPPRTWLYGKHYQRRTVSLTAGPGGMGKSSLDMVEAIAMATTHNLLGEQPEERLRVWYHNGEDPLDEINRRIAAICQHYGIPQTELQGYLFVTSGNEFPLRVAKGYNDLRIDHALVQQISAALGENQIDLAIFDPFVTLHNVSEVDSGKMDTVVRLFASIGDENDCGIEIAHHVRKPVAGTNGDYDVHDIRGVAAITDAVRAARVLNRMNEKDAESAGCSDIERLSRFRVDRAKGNYSPAQAATWRQFVSVELANGDDVGVVAPWNFPGQGERTPERAEADQKAEHVFLQLLDKLLDRNMNVSANSGHNYAPAKFAEEQEAIIAKVSKAAFKAAMRRLLDAGRIRTEPVGRGDRPSQHRLVPWQGTPK